MSRIDPLRTFQHSSGAASHCRARSARSCVPRIERKHMLATYAFLAPTRSSASSLARCCMLARWTWPMYGIVTVLLLAGRPLAKRWWPCRGCRSVRDSGVAKIMCLAREWHASGTPQPSSSLQPRWIIHSISDSCIQCGLAPSSGSSVGASAQNCAITASCAGCVHLGLQTPSPPRLKCICVAYSGTYLRRPSRAVWAAFGATAQPLPGTQTGQGRRGRTQCQPRRR